MEQREYVEISALTATRARTRRLLIDTAIQLFDSGACPTVTELAQHANLSRATAYRYFPTQTALISAMAAETLNPVISWQPTQQGAWERIDELLSFALPHMLKHEGALRAAQHLMLTGWSQTQSDAVDILPARDTLARGKRLAMLNRVVEPLHQEMSPRLVERVVRALSLVYCSELFLVMKDVWGCDNDELQETGKWIARAIIQQARAEAQVQEVG